MRPLRRPPALLVHGVLLLVSCLYGVNYVATKRVLAEVPAPAWVFYRIALATTLMLPLAALLGAGWPQRSHYKHLALASALGIAINQVLFAEGMARTTPGRSAVINAAIPLLTLFFAVAARQERLMPRKLLAIFVALSGVVVLLKVDTLTGDLLTLGNATCFSAFLVLMRRIGRDVEPLAATSLCFLFGGAWIALWSASSLDGPSWQALWGPTVWPWALHAIAGATVLTYLLNNWALRHTASSQVALYIYVQPVVATGLSMLLGLESPSLRFWAGAALVFTGIVIEVSGRSSSSTA